MDPDLYAQRLIAHYLKQHRLNDTLRAFEIEVNRKFDTDSIDESLTVLVKDYLEFQGLESSAEHHRVGSNGESEGVLPIKASAALNTTLSNNSVFTMEQQRLIEDRQISIDYWTVRCPEKKTKLDLFQKTLVIFSNVDHVTLDGEVRTVGLFSTSSRSVCIYDLENRQVLVRGENLGGRSPVKAMACIPGTAYVLICSMNGNLSISAVKKDANSGDYSISSIGKGVSLHRKLITSVAYRSFGLGSGYFCSLGWDCRLVVCKVANENTDSPELINVGSVLLPTQGTCVTVLRDDELELPVVLVGRVDSSFVHVFTVCKRKNNTGDGTDIQHNESIVGLAKLSLNDSEFSSHVFHPMAITQSSRGVVSVATSHTPYLRVVTFALPSVREMLSKAPSVVDSCSKSDSSTLLCELRRMCQKGTDDRLNPNVPVMRNVIVSNFSGMTPQDKFSTPVLMSRPAGRSGIWVVGNDGLIRGFDLRIGKVVETICAHEGRIKTVSAGYLTGEGHNEVIVSCGAVDRAIYCWSE